MTTDNGVDVSLMASKHQWGDLEYRAEENLMLILFWLTICQWGVTSSLIWWQDIYWSCINLCEPIQADAILYREGNWHVPGSCKFKQNDVVKFVHMCFEYLWCCSIQQLCSLKLH